MNYNTEDTKNIVRFFDIAEGTNKPGNHELEKFLKVLESNGIAYNVSINENSSIVMVIAIGYKK